MMGFDGNEDDSAGDGVTTLPTWQTQRVTPIDQHIGSRIRDLRMKRKLSMSKLGAAVGVSTGQIQKYERAENAVVCSRLHDIARVLQVEPGYFFEEFSPDFGVVFTDVGPEPARPPLTSEAVDLAHEFMGLDRSQRGLVRAMVDQLRAAATGADDGGGTPANEPDGRRFSGAAD